MVKIFKTSQLKVVDGFLYAGKEIVTNTRLADELTGFDYLSSLAEQAKDVSFEPAQNKEQFLSNFKRNYTPNKISVIDVEQPKLGKITTQLKREAEDFLEKLEETAVDTRIDAIINDSFKQMWLLNTTGIVFNPGAMNVKKLYTKDEMISTLRILIQKDLL